MKKVILILLSITALVSTSCKKVNQLEPTISEQRIVKKTTLVEDTLNVSVFYTNHFNSIADTILTVVDITNGEGSTVFIKTTTLDGIINGNTYTGNKIQFPRTSGTNRIYRVYLGGRIFDNTQNIFVGKFTNTRFPNGWVDVSVGTVLSSFPDRTPIYFTELDQSNISTTNPNVYVVF